MQHLESKDIHSNLAFVSKEPFIFNDSLIGNIRLANKAVSMEDLKEIARICDLHEFDVSCDKYNQP